MPPARYLTLLCHQIWPSETIIPQITEVPVLFLSGLRDEMVPYVFISLIPSLLPNDDFNFHPQKLKPFWAPIKIWVISTLLINILPALQTMPYVTCELLTSRHTDQAT